MAKDKLIAALEVVHGALKPLKPEERKSLLASVNALLHISVSTEASGEKLAGDPTPAVSASETASPARETGSRPVAIRELIQDKGAHNHRQLITLFAYYREKYQGQTKFSRDDLKQYYQAAREHPPRNYDRDFVEVVRRGWIHEEKDNSYITTKGIEAVESGFSGSRDKRAKTTKTSKRGKKTGR
jgi:hypothetical protein